MGQNQFSTQALARRAASTESTLSGFSARLILIAMRYVLHRRLTKLTVRGERRSLILKAGTASADSTARPYAGGVDERRCG